MAQLPPPPIKPGYGPALQVTYCVLQQLVMLYNLHVCVCVFEHTHVFKYTSVCLCLFGSIL